MIGQDSMAFQIGRGIRRKGVEPVVGFLGEPGMAAMGGLTGFGLSRWLENHEWFKNNVPLQRVANVLGTMAGAYLGSNISKLPKASPDFSVETNPNFMVKNSSSIMERLTADPRKDILEALRRAGFPADVQLQGAQVVQSLSQAKAAEIAGKLRFAGGGAALAILLINLLGLGNPMSNVIGGLSGAAIGAMFAPKAPAPSFQAIPYGTPFSNYL